MPHFVVLGKFTQKRMETIKGLPASLKDATELFKAHGAQMKGLVFTLGQYDVVGIFEAPSAEAIAKALLSWGSQGPLQTETLMAFTGEEMVKLIQGL